MIPVRGPINPDSLKAGISDGKFRKKEHILKSRDFRCAYKKGRSFRKSGFVLVSAPNGLTHNRLGFSIGGANVKRAIIRNRIRRLFRELYRKNRAIFRPGFDMIVIARRDPGRRFSHEDAQQIFLELSKEAGILL